MNTSLEKPITVLHCYARSGGTLFSKCIANLRDVVLVSEVNPNLNAKGSIKKQLADWYGLQIPEGSYVDMVKSAYEACLKVGKNFVIRDFSFIDFTPHALNELKPAEHFSSLELLKDELPIKPVAFVRDAFDVWISRGCPPKFSVGYLKYIQSLLESGIAIFTYEDFCADPNKVLQEFCDETGLHFDARATSLAIKETKVTGDIDLKAPSRGGLKNQIVPLVRKRLPKDLIKMARQDEALKKANWLLDYSDDILDAEFEPNPSQWFLELEWKVKRLLNIYPKDLY